MPGAVGGGSTKRKGPSAADAPKKRARSESGEDVPDSQSRILLLETSILESRKNYNNIAALIAFTKNRDGGGESALAAALCLCRVFLRLLAAGQLVKRKSASERDVVVVQWLRERLVEYKDILLSMLLRPEFAVTALTLSMRLLKAETRALNEQEDYNVAKVFMAQIVSVLVRTEADEIVRREFLEAFVNKYDDVRFYTFKALKDVLLGATAPSNETGSADGGVASNAFNILAAIEGVPKSDDELGGFFIGAPEKKTHSLYSLNKHKKQAQEAWLAVMRTGLDREQRKTALDIMAGVIAPWFTNPELLMDFLTDSYNTGGSMSLLALSGVFYLIQERNLDYPSFYTKLYSLLDADILHSKHRSRFFRLLDIFLSSSHLPAVLVASFVKRMSRLCLNAPPAAIVAVVPWIYNFFKKHPLCTFMIHRVPRSGEERGEYEAEGMDDPFMPDEPDPMETRAIDSCLWEIVQLQSHYHPNVATIAKIISEQFTKQFYNLEDFLDHSYGSLLEAEMSKEVKKAPVVEFMIPKRIFFPVEGGAEETGLLTQLWDFGSSQD